jgi:hypothetical protein
LLALLHHELLHPSPLCAWRSRPGTKLRNLAESLERIEKRLADLGSRPSGTKASKRFRQDIHRVPTQRN